MRRWRARSISNHDTSDPQLEAGLANPNRTTSRITEESEDVADASLTSMTHEPKTDVEHARRGTLERRATFADDHIEDIQAADEKQEAHPTLTRTKTAAARLFKWSRSGKQEDQSAQDENTQDEKTDNTLKLKKSKSGASQAPPEYAEEYTNEARYVVESFNGPTTEYENKEAKYVPLNIHTRIS